IDHARCDAFPKGIGLALDSCQTAPSQVRQPQVKLRQPVQDLLLTLVGAFGLSGRVSLLFSRLGVFLGALCPASNPVDHPLRRGGGLYRIRLAGSHNEKPQPMLAGEFTARACTLEGWF